MRISTTSIAAIDTESRSNPDGIRSQASTADGSYRILVVDDNMVNGQIAMQAIKVLGYQADFASSGHDAIDMQARCAYDLILMDCQMPVLDGFQTTACIRSSETENRRVPIIGWTSTTVMEERETCIAAGMDDMLTKPLHIGALKTRIEYWLGKRGLLPEPEITEVRDGLAAILQRFGEHFDQLAAIYRHDTPQRMTALVEGLAAGDLSTIRKTAHVLSGSCASIGALKLAQLCRQLENSCNAENHARLRVLVDKIHEQYIETDCTITTMLQSRKK